MTWLMVIPTGILRNFKNLSGYLFLLSLCYLSGIQGISGQDYSWWNTRHQWDGVTHWSRYMILSPAFMGPNALPVPEIKTGQLSSHSHFKLGGEGHFSRGDQTLNLTTELYIPLFSPRAGLHLQVVPFERYVLDTETRDQRVVRDFDGKGTAFGDLYLGTQIQLLQESKNLPAVALSVNLKTASGNNLAAARFTDTPGYYFDVSAGKTISPRNTIIDSIRPYLMIGLYVWQTYQTDHYQNDCFLYGLGFDLNIQKWMISNSLGGYSGYIGNGDQPLVYRFTLRSQFEKYPNLSIRFQEGLSDFPYTSCRFSLLLKL